MRLTLFLPTLAFLSLFPLLAFSFSPGVFPYRRDHARSPASSVIASRQYRFPRDLLDVCINVNANILADASQLLGLSSLLGALNVGTDIELCLCLKDLDIFLDTNDSIQALVGLLGKNTVGALITALINTSPEAQHCTFPPHAHHTCDTSDPCHYACDPPYVSDGDQCVCAPPQMSCNGVCDIFPQGCSSSVPRALTKRSNSIVTIAQAQASCKSTESVCGIAGREKTLSFECIDTSSTKDSCGGCMTPHPFFEAHPLNQPSGIDCSTIPNAKATACSSSRCVVKSCNEGWSPSLDKNSCIPVHGSASKMLKVRKPSEVITDSDSTMDLSALITSVVKLVIALNIHAPGTKLIDSTGSPSATDLTNIDAIYNLLDGVNAATAGLVSSSVPLASSYSNALLDTCSLLRTTLDDCNCIQSLSIYSFSDDLNKLIAAIGNLQAGCSQNPNANLLPPASSGELATATATTASSSTTNPSDKAIVVGLTTLLSDLGIHGKSGVVVDNLVSPDTAKSVNGLPDNLGLGPANYKRQALPPLTAVVNATIDSNSDLLSQVTVVVNLIIKLAGCVDSSPSSTSPGALASGLSGSPSSAIPSPVIPSTGSLTSSLSTCLIDPILFGTLYRYSLNLVKSPDLLSFCKNTGLLYAAECNLRELFNDCAYVDELGLGEVLADLLLALEETRYLESWCSSNANGAIAHSTTFISVPTISVGVSSSAVHSSTSISIASISSVASVTSVTGRSTSAGIVTPGTTLSVAASLASITSSTSSLAHSSATLASSTFISSHTLASVSLTLHSASTLTHIPTTSTIVAPTTGAVTSTPSSSNSASHFTITAAPPADTPIIVSLDDVLSDLGLNGTTAVVTVDGLLGNQGNEAVDQILNGVGIGPLNVRKRMLMQNRPDRRQVLANVNVITNLSGLGDSLNGLVDLVLGLKLVGDVLPPAATSPSVLPPPAATPSVVPSLPLPLPSLPGVLDPSSPLIDQGLVDNVLAATLALLSLSWPTYSQFLQGLGQIVSTSSESMNTIRGCSCASGDDHLDEVYQYLTEIVEAAEELENLCQNQAGSSTDGISQAHSSLASASAATTSAIAAGASASAAPSSGDEPIIVGLTKLLKGLGLDIDSDVVVDHLLSNDVDHTVNTILNSLGIGPNGARRRFVGRERSDW